MAHRICILGVALAACGGGGATRRPVAPSGTATAGFPRGGRLVDLSHPFDEATLYWPTSPSGVGGTHLDSPIHVAERGSTTEEVALDRLIAPAVATTGRATPPTCTSRASARRGRAPAGAAWVAAVGIDTASIDRGPSTDFIAHQVLMGADIPAFENVAALEGIPPRGAVVIALPMKIRGGSGGPLRIVAWVP